MFLNIFVNWGSKTLANLKETIRVSKRITQPRRMLSKMVKNQNEKKRFSLNESDSLFKHTREWASSFHSFFAR